MRLAGMTMEEQSRALALKPGEQALGRLEGENGQWHEVRLRDAGCWKGTVVWFVQTRSNERPEWDKEGPISRELDDRDWIKLPAGEGGAL